MQTLFLVLHLIVSVILIFVVMAQEGKRSGYERYSRLHPLIWAIHSLRKMAELLRKTMFIKLTTTIAILFLIATTQFLLF